MSQLSEKIAAEIRMQGAIPFVRFMELALYCPVYGYYEKERDTIGRRGDFFTNVSVGSLFGELLAGCFAEWLESLSPKSKVQGPRSNIGHPGCGRVQIVEAGAHEGQLALDILTALKDRCPGMSDRLDYWIVEPSPQRQSWQRKTLVAFATQVRWADDLQELVRAQEREGSGVNGIIFCNELLDAMPVRRLGWDAARRWWFEWGVALEGEGFAWRRMREVEIPGHVFALDQKVEGLAGVLPDGFTVEICPAAADWWRLAAESLAEGKLLAIDYGLTDEELLMPERKQGTLRSYRDHRLSPDILICPGEQDLTAHVNFGLIQRVGEAAGLRTEGLLVQSQFLTPLAQRVVTEWTPKRRNQFQTLTHPEHLGRAFRVLVQSRSSKVNS